MVSLLICFPSLYPFRPFFLAIPHENATSDLFHGFIDHQCFAKRSRLTCKYQKKSVRKKKAFSLSW